MKKAVTICSSEFEAQAQKIVSLALTLCENRIKANQGTITSELLALSAAALSLEKSVTAFVTIERLCK